MNKWSKLSPLILLQKKKKIMAKVRGNSVVSFKTTETV